MISTWPVAKLGEVLRKSEEWISTDPSQDYKEITVRLWGKGVVLRRVAKGSEIGASRRVRARAGQFILSRIDARNGAIGVVPPELDGAVVSNDFPTFDLSTQHLVPAFLGWMSKTAAFVDRCRAASEGTTNRVRLQEERFLVQEIPLPPLEEQRRIVARLDVFCAKITEAHSLSRQALDEAEAVFEEARATLFQGALRQSAVSLQDLAKLERGKFSHRPRNDQRFFGGSHPWIQIAEIERSGKFIREWCTTLNDEGLGISKKFPQGTVLVSIAATIGAVGILDFDCCVPDSVVGVTSRGGMDGEFLYHFLGFVRSHLESVAPQSAQKNINLKILSRLRTPRLPLSEQRRIVVYLDGLQAMIDALKRLQAEASAELDALMPAILDGAFRGKF